MGVPKQTINTFFFSSYLMSDHQASPLFMNNPIDGKRAIPLVRFSFI